MAHISGVGAFFLIVFIVALIGGIAWIVYTHLRARRLGLPQPSISSYNPFRSASDRYGGSASGQGGMLGWVKDKVNGLKNRNNRSAGGAYEEPLSGNVRGRAANRGFGPLDPDDAWDARVGTEADAYGPGGYYEEQELGLHGGHPGISATPGPPELSSPPRGRSLSRGSESYVGGSKAGLDRRYDEEMGIQPANNPFNDAAELRGVSPRPMDSNTKAHRLQDDNHSERRSMFRENM
ncbi:hypothetical protein MFRU_005g03550 [Monilinia fructicola]|uniref:Acid phosphatase-like protein n=1 Tax=Monilinia fructicola TaxID=38448 RepID=A0A5M9JQF8_MONFR|nr:hypothetical protein EYC84_002570 [Monilinia fructicola]KAG4033345.1 hypothetical protein MFRU_005g03550 [Monilinia fructicola]